MSADACGRRQGFITGVVSMPRVFFLRSSFVVLLCAGLTANACSSAVGKAAAPAASAGPIAIASVIAVEEPIARFIRVTGSLTAEDQASVAAEVAARVEAAPVERGTAVSLGTELVRLSSTETEAQLQEAEANAAQLEARLGLARDTAFDVNAVPEVQNAKAAYTLAESEFGR